MERSRTTSGVVTAGDPRIGRVVLGRFRVLEKIGRGGMGRIYVAEQLPLGRRVALKMLDAARRTDVDEDFEERFFLEASVCARLTHPNTITLFDYGVTEDGTCFIAMELLEGRTLEHVLKHDGPLPAERAVRIARQVCRSLREAHALGVIHRDLKPANVFLTRSGDEADFVKVLDFGLVKRVTGDVPALTKAGTFLGSPRYMSPEQIQNEKLDGRADVYSLGVLLFEMLAGRVPFERATPIETMMAQVDDEPPRLADVRPDAGIPPAIEAVVMKALAKRPDDRFASMDELLLALKRASEEAGLPKPSAAEAARGSGQTGEYAAVNVEGPLHVGPIGAPSGIVPRAAPPPSPRGKRRIELAIAIAALAIAVLALALAVVR